MERFHDAEQSSRGERPHPSRRVDDPIRRRANSSSEQSSSRRDSGKDTASEHDNSVETKHALSEFKEAFQTEIQPLCTRKFEITSWNSEGYYQNTIDLDHGKIIGINNLRVQGKRHLSDVVYNQILFALEEAKKDISEFNLKSWYGSNITNKDTSKIANEVGDGTFSPENWQFSKILNSQTGKSKVYIANDHFPNKKVVKIIVKSNDSGTFDIEYIYEETSL